MDNTAWAWLWSELERLLGPEKVQELREEMRQHSHRDYVRSERNRRAIIVRRFAAQEAAGTLTDIGKKILERERSWLASHPLPEEDA